MNHLELRAGRRDGVQFTAEENALLRARAVEQGEFKVLGPVADGTGQGQEGRDARTAGEADDLLLVAQRLVVEEALRTG